MSSVRLPASSYAPNGAIVADTSGMVVGQNSVITYRSENDGQPQPAWLGMWGYGQSQQDPGGSSILSNQVLIEPGLGSTRPITSFSFSTILNQDPFHEEGEPKPPPIYIFDAGDGTVEGNILTPNGLAGQGVTIRLLGKDAEGPATWFIILDNTWFSKKTEAGSLRFRVTFELLGQVNSNILAKRSVEAGAKVYKYPQKVKGLPK